MATENKNTIAATPEQIAAFDALIGTLTAKEQAAVLRTWRLAQSMGYRTASKRVFALVPAHLTVVGGADEEAEAVA